VELVCRRGYKGVTYVYEVGGVEYKDGDQAPCDDEVPTDVEIVYFPEEPQETRMLYGDRFEMRRAAGR